MQVLLGVLNAFADRLGNFARLAETETNDAVAVADDNESGKLKDAAALHGFGYTVDGNNLFL